MEHVQQPRGPGPAGRGRRRAAGAARRHRRDPARARGHPGVPARGARRRPRRRWPTRGCPTSTAPTCRWSPSTRPAPRTSTRRCTSSADGDGYVLHYAIADLAAFITPGDPVDLEAHRRGQTLYGADSRIPLHPTVISEDGGSLLPDQVRPALLWTIRLDGEGARTDVEVERARVRSRAQLDYPGAQQAIDDGSADESLMLLKEVGELRLRREAARGGVSLPLPEQEVDTAGGGVGAGVTATCCPVEEWNAQMSLLTGFAAASLMMYARVGFLRTLPPPDPRDVQRLHRTAHALGIDWPAELLFADFIRGLDASKPQHAAMIVGLHPAAARQRVRRLRRRDPGPAAAQRAQRRVRPRHRAAAPARRPLRLRGLRRAVRRRGGAGLGARRAARAGPGDAGVLPAGQPLRADGPRPGRGRAARSTASARASTAVVVEVNEKDPTRGIVTVADPAVEAPVVSAADAPARHRRPGPAHHRRRGAAQGRVHPRVILRRPAPRATATTR